MPQIVRIEQFGTPEVMKLVETPAAAPGPGEVLLRHTAIGLNFIDTYNRSGLYPMPLPFTPGQEAAGVIEAVGDGVSDWRVGERVAYAGGPVGAYASKRVMSPVRLVRLPEGVSDEAAAALLLKGMTAYYLLHLTFAVRAGHLLLVHAAAGGVGSVLVPWAKYLGAGVIGTTGSPEKAALARSYGCDEVILYREQDVAAEVRRITNGRGVDVVYDSVGKDTLAGSLDSLKRRGLLVSFGNASGKPPPIEPSILAAKGSLFLTRPVLGDYTSTREELGAAATALFDLIAKGIVRAEINQRYPLRDVARAHADLEGRRTTGATLLLP